MSDISLLHINIGALSLMIRKNLLVKASGLVQSQETEISENNVDNRIRAQIWFDITNIAWDGKLYDVCLSGIAKVLQYKWTVAVDSMFLLQQARALLMKAEIMAIELDKLGFKPGKIELPVEDKDSDVDDDDSDEDEDDEYLDEKTHRSGATQLTARVKLDPLLQMKLNKGKKLNGDLLDSFLQAIAIGQSIEEDWIVLNAVTQLWNFHLPLYQNQSNFIQTLRDTTGHGHGNIGSATNAIPLNLRNALVVCHAALLGLPTQDVGLICNVGNVIALSFEEEGQYDQAIKVSAATCEVESVHQKRDVLSVLARVNKKSHGGKHGGKDNSSSPGTDDRQANAFMVLELLKSPLLSADEKHTLLTDVTSSMLNAINNAAVAAASSGEKKGKEKKAKKAEKKATGKGKKGDTERGDDELTTRQNLAKEVEEKKISDQVDVELWSQLCCEALSLATQMHTSGDRLQTHGVSMQAAKLTLATAPIPDPKSYRLHHKDWKTIPAVYLRCYSIAQNVLGQNLVLLINPDQHTKPSQDKIRLRALHHFNLSAYFGELSLRRAETEGKPPLEIQHISELVLEAAKQTWNTAFSFFQDAPMRKPIQGFFRRLVC